MDICIRNKIIKALKVRVTLILRVSLCFREVERVPPLT